MNSIGILSIIIILYSIFSLIKHLKKQGTVIRRFPNPPSYTTPKSSAFKQVKNNYPKPGQANSDERPLKRCPNCGGEIPVEMIKCDLCGHRNNDFGAITKKFGLIAFIAYMVIMFLMGVLNLDSCTGWTEF
jgi:hypothetical protein